MPLVKADQLGLCLPARSSQVVVISVAQVDLLANTTVISFTLMDSLSDHEIFLGCVFFFYSEEIVTLGFPGGIFRGNNENIDQFLLIGNKENAKCLRIYLLKRK